MAAYSSVPLAGLDVLPPGALLQIQFATAVEHMQVHHRMQQHRASVALAASSAAHNLPIFVHYGEYLGIIVFHRRKYLIAKLINIT